MRVLFALILIVLCTVTSAQDVSGSAGKVKAQFLGASGKMKLYPSTGDGKSDYILVSQNKLEEHDGGKKASGSGKSLNVAGQNSWTPLTANADKTAYHTTFQTAEGNVKFKLTCHLIETTTTVVDATMCNNCTSGAGACKNSTGFCTADNNQVCEAGASLCTMKTTAKGNQLKFSIQVSGWSFTKTSNTLKYGIVVEAKSSKSTASSVEDGTNGKKQVNLNGGYVVLPTKGYIKGAANDKEINVGITTSLANGKYSVDFEFPSFGAGESLYYDPDIGTDTDTGTTYSGVEKHHVCFWSLLFLSLVNIAVLR